MITPYDFYAASVLGKDPELVDPVKYEIPKPSTCELIEKILDKYDEKHRADKYYIQTNNPYGNWVRDEYLDRFRAANDLINAYDKEKEINNMEKLRIIEQELMEMAKRYNLGLKKEYNYAVDELKITFDKDTRFGWEHEHMVVTKVGTRDVRETLERIEHRIVETFRIDLNKLDVVIPTIKNVIHNDAATIVFWADNTKTVVKCQDGDIYDPEKGLAMAISKKALGNRGNYCEVFKKWLPEEDKQEQIFEIKIGDSSLMNAARDAREAITKVTLSARDIGEILGKGNKK